MYAHVGCGSNGLASARVARKADYLTRRSYTIIQHSRRGDGQFKIPDDPLILSDIHRGVQAHQETSVDNGRLRSEDRYLRGKLEAATNVIGRLQRQLEHARQEVASLGKIFDDENYIPEEHKCVCTPP